MRIPLFAAVLICGQAFSSSTVLAQSWTLERSMEVFAVADSSTHVVVDADGDLIAFGRSTAIGGSVSIHARHAGGVNAWEAISVIHDPRPGFGRALDLHNGALAVGIPGNNPISPAGAVLLIAVDPANVNLPVTVIGEVTPANGLNGDRFGEAVRLSDDMLLVGATGRPHPKGSGAVYTFERTGDGLVECGLLQPDPVAFQLPQLHRFGAQMDRAGDQLVIAAPLSGFTSTFNDQGQFRNVIGSLHVHERSDPCLWAETDTYFNLTTAFDSTVWSSVFVDVEVGRRGLALSASGLIVHVSGPRFTTEPNIFNQPPSWELDDDGRVTQTLFEGCRDCGLIQLQHAGTDWTVVNERIPVIGPGEQLGLGAWTALDEHLFVNIFDTVSTTWRTDHWIWDAMTSAWTTWTSIPEAETCGSFNAPLAWSDDLLARVVLVPDCPDTSGTYKLHAELYRITLPVGMAQAAEVGSEPRLYPNPSTDELIITSRTSLDPEVVIVNALGGRYPRQATGLGDGTWLLRLENMPAGLYHVLVQEREQVERYGLPFVVLPH